MKLLHLAILALGSLLIAALLPPPEAWADCCQIPVYPPAQLPPDQKPPPPGKKPPPPVQQDDKKPGTQDGGDQLTPIGPDGQVWFSQARNRAFREPVQQAVVAWNGRQEVLVLSVQQQTLVKQGTMLGVLPLPGKPLGVERADPKLFARAVSLYRTKAEEAGRAFGRDMKVLIQKDIGAHHIVVVEAGDEEAFLVQMQAYVARHVKNGAALFNAEVRSVIRAYHESGFKYFAFDLQKVTPDLKVKEAIAYHFETDWLYYPLAISRIGGTGETKIQLMVLSPGTLNKYKGLDDKLIQSAPPVDFTSDDLRKLDPTIARVMGGGSVRGRIWTITGRLDGFKADLFAAEGKPTE